MKKTFVLLSALLLSVSVSAAKTPKIPAGVQPEAAPAIDKPKDADKWEKKVAAFEQADAKNPPPKGGIEFVGSSTIERWTTLAQDLPDLAVFNRGIGGSQTKHALFFAPRIIIPYAPRIVVLHGGGNDLDAGVKPAVVIDNIKKLVELIQAKLPKTEFCFIGLRPSPRRSEIYDEQQEVNKAIQEYVKITPRTHYINQYDMVLDANGELRPELFAKDNLHLNAEGYKLLVERVRPLLEKIIREIDKPAGSGQISQ